MTRLNRNDAVGRGRPVGHHLLRIRMEHFSQRPGFAQVNIRAEEPVDLIALEDDKRWSREPIPEYTIK
jgi:hypothetical protein